jgi:hypothetical protein
VLVAQSVTDAARQSREQRAKAASKPAKTLTNDDVDHSSPVGVARFPTVQASFFIPPGWTLGGTTDQTVLFFCPGTERADQCFILVRIGVPQDFSPRWQDHCLLDGTREEPISGTTSVLLEPWHDVTIGGLPARQTVLETGIGPESKNPSRHDLRKYIELADPASKRCYSLSIYALVGHAEKNFATFDALVASFRPFPSSPQGVAGPADGKP